MQNFPEQLYKGMSTRIHLANKNQNNNELEKNTTQLTATVIWIVLL